MKVEISNGYVLLSESITRKVARAYDNILMENATTDDSGNVKINIGNVAKASEALVLSLVEKICVVDQEGKESYTEPNNDWLDNLQEKDFKIIEEKALKIRALSVGNVKK